jgi:hypothetical protein
MTDLSKLTPNAKTIAALKSRPKPLVSDDEVRSAEDMLRRLCEAAGKEPPIPAIFIRRMLEEAAMTRMGMFSGQPPQHP